MQTIPRLKTFHHHHHQYCYHYVLDNQPIRSIYCKKARQACSRELARQALQNRQRSHVTELCHARHAEYDSRLLRMLSYSICTTLIGYLT